MTAMMALYVAALLINAGLAYFFGKQAEYKGYSFGLGFFLCLVGSPFLALIVVLWLPDRDPKPKVNSRLLLEIELEKARIELAARDGNA